MRLMVRAVRTTDDYGYAFCAGVELQYLEQLPGAIRFLKHHIQNNQGGMPVYDTLVSIFRCVQNANLVRFFLKEAFHKPRQILAIVDDDNTFDSVVRATASGHKGVCESLRVHVLITAFL